MAKYMPAAVVVDAFQYTGDLQAAFDWMGQWYGEDDGPGMHEDEFAGKPALVVDEGTHELWLAEGDWLVRDVESDFHVYRNAAFEKMYMPMPEKSKEKES